MTFGPPTLTPPDLPLVLLETPPGPEIMLAQEGVPFVRADRDNPLALLAGRFVLHDGRPPSRGGLGPNHVVIDIDSLGVGHSVDPFAAMLETRAARFGWDVGPAEVGERVCLVDKARIRRSVIDRLRARIEGYGGTWARLAPYPFPYRSAFNLRVDLDEPYPDDYARFAQARRGLESCTTHFVSTQAYGQSEDVLADLRDLDVQSHGHFHVVYRDPDANLRNLERAHAILVEHGIIPTGFAGPEGRWNAGLDRAMRTLGYDYSSEFQVGYGDLPFFPWVDGAWSPVLQVPVHPVCEGVFLEAGIHDPGAIGRYLRHVMTTRIEAGEPAFVYGHPERRLGRFPGVIESLGWVLEGRPLVWRTTLTEFAAWWRWRSEQRWSLHVREEGRLEVQFEEWETRHPLGLEIFRGSHSAFVPLPGPKTVIGLADLALERIPAPSSEVLPAAVRRRERLGWKATLRAALDWETITPSEELPRGTLRAELKRGLRRWRDRPEARS